MPQAEPAPVWRRVAAFCYDLLLLTAIVVCFTLAVLAVRMGAAVPPGSWWFPLCLVAIAAAFFSGFWALGGQTVGMRAWRIRVVRDDGTMLTIPQAFARFAAGIVLEFFPNCKWSFSWRTALAEDHGAFRSRSCVSL